MSSAVRILSDLHLGHRISRIASVESLRPLIAGTRRVVFNGDTWQELARPFRERSAVMLDELRGLCAEEGVEPVFLPGNHDPGWPGEGWMELAGGRILVTHGDAFFPEGSPWCREAMQQREAVGELWRRRGEAATGPAERIVVAREMARLLAAREYPKGRRIWQRAFDAVRPPRRAFEILRVWATQADAAVDFAERYFPRAEIIIKGHFHRSGVWQRRGKLVVNLGAFMNPCRALWADFDGSRFRCGRIDERGGECRIGEIHGVWRLPESF